VTLPKAGVAVAGIAFIGARLSQATLAAAALSEAILYLEDYERLDDLVPTNVQVARSMDQAPPTFCRIAVKDLTFTYPGSERTAVHDVSMHIDAGEVVALVGENGSGKTTLAKLLAGLYKPNRGRISWDGTDISAVEPLAFRRKVAVVFQDFIRYHLPVRDNIGMGRHEAIDDLDSIQRAARQAGAEEFIAMLQHGYDTMLGPEFFGGTDLSTGQWQRIALARAFFRDSPFVILDEPTAALDARSERDLFNRIRQLLTGRTVLLISHRFSSVASADRIYVLADGEIREEGTHEELIQRGGIYAELFKLQAEPYLRLSSEDRAPPSTEPNSESTATG
jgi:ATP-binding cassette subfamily B protein